MIKKIKSWFRSAEKTPKELATAKGEQWVEILSFNLNPKNPSEGAFELDWNQKFIDNLREQGYNTGTDEEIVDRWFSTICKNIMLETYENEIADPEKRAAMVQREKLNGEFTAYE